MIARISGRKKLYTQVFYGDFFSVIYMVFSIINYAKNIPIIAMTAEAFNEEVRKAYDCGMNAYIAKPINVRDLIKTILSVV